MKKFKDIYEAVMGVQQRKKAARRMAKRNVLLSK